MNVFMQTHYVGFKRIYILEIIHFYSGLYVVIGTYLRVAAAEYVNAICSAYLCGQFIFIRKISLL